MKRFLVAALFVVASSASAVPSDTAIAFNSAINGMNKRFGPAEERRSPPNSSDPAVAADLAVILGAREQFGTPAFPVLFPDTFVSVCAPLQQLGNRYVVAGLPSNELLGANAAKATQNSHRYQNILSPIFAFSLKCMALHMPGFQKFWRDLPESERTEQRKGGIRMVRSGTVMALKGIVSVSVEKATSPANQKLMIDTAAAYTDELSIVLPPRDRRKLLGDIERTVPTFKRIWPKQYAAIRSALLNPACADLCLVE